MGAREEQILEAGKGFGLLLAVVFAGLLGLLFSAVLLVAGYEEIFTRREVIVLVRHKGHFERRDLSGRTLTWTKSAPEETRCERVYTARGQFSVRAARVGWRRTIYDLWVARRQAEICGALRPCCRYRIVAVGAGDERLPIEPLPVRIADVREKLDCPGSPL